MRKQIAAANWKMNLTLEQANQLADDLLNTEVDLSADHQVIFAVPFPYIIPVKQKIGNRTNFFVAAQNCYSQKAGAFTGEVSAEMLYSIGTEYVVVGHSERREYFKESNEELGEKIQLCLQYNLKPIFCCGEPLSIRTVETQNAYVETQLKESLFDLKADQLSNFVIAYEPIWAIGTGKTASAEQAEEMHAYIRKVISDQYGNEVAESISILYGGSVKGANAKEIFSQPNVDGGLVGGASLSAQEFLTIIKSLK